MVDQTRVKPTQQNLLAANETQVLIDGEIRLPVAVGSTRTFANFLVSPNVSDVILGRDWLVENNVTWQFGESTVQIHGRRHPLVNKEESHRQCWCAVKSATNISPRSEAIVTAYVVRSSLNLNTTADNWSTVLAEPKRGLRVARSLTEINAPYANIRVCNVTDRPIQLSEGQTLSLLQPVDVLDKSPQLNEPTSSSCSSEIIQQMVNRADPTVPQETKAKLASLLSSYVDVFSLNEFDLGSTDLVQHQINTGQNKPFRQPLRPQARAHLPVIDNLLQEMQKQGVIEPCTSEWASNIVLVKKKDGSYRFCVDYRKLNDLTVKDAYPLPRIDTCLDSLAGAVWFSTFDLRSGFHQVRMDPKDVNKTTFVCHRGTFRFPKMPFGLCNAPATFQRLMDLTMLGLNFEICLIYLDDIILFSKDLASHMQRLELLFTRLREANLKLKPSKCQLLQRKVSFLGFVVSSHGIGTDSDKISAIVDWPRPKNLRESRAFIGLCQYYRRFVPNFSTIAAPIHALTKKGALFNWNDACENAFLELKKLLSGAEVLALPSENGQYILDCDASDQAIGAVLSQIQDGVERPLCFASQLYNKHEKNYNVTRKELLAVVTFVRKFRQYLLGKPFIIRSDHAALQWLKHTPEPIGQQARWLEILEEFDYTIQHRAGVKHGNADALSRRPPSEDDGLVAACRRLDPDWRRNRHPNNDTVQAETTDINMVPAFNWVEIQKQDPDIRFVYDLVAVGANRPDHAEISAKSADVKTLCTLWDQLSVTSSGILVRNKTTAGRPCQQQKVVPYAYRNDIAVDMHKGLNGGHLGLKRAKHQFQQRFYWPGWAKDVELAQLRCERCSKFKRPSNSRQGFLQPMLSGEPWERIGLDITGPHPTSARGNVYILTLIDHFTKWIEIFPMRNQEAATVAKLLVDRVFCVYGLPMQILTDQGRNFESDLFREICRFLSVDKIRTTAYKPSTNGNIERFHATLNSMLAKMVSENQRDWDDKLSAVAFAYRNSAQESTGFSPYYLMYGREARIPADIVYGPPGDGHPAYTSNSEFVADQQTKLREAFTLVREHLGTAAERRKDRYDMRVRPKKYPAGTWVYCLIPRRRQNRSHKWQSFYEGPYLVIQEIGEVNLLIQRSARSKPFVVHVDKLKPCYEQGLQSWLETDHGETVTVQSEIGTHEAASHSTGDSTAVRSDAVDMSAPTSRPRRHAEKPARYRAIIRKS